MEKVWLYAAIGGFVPTLFWLFFWLREDTLQPEPKRLILITFIFGILSAFLSLIIQASIDYSELVSDSFIKKIIIFAFVEELLKYGAVFFIALPNAEFNERMDPVIYMITAALGFVAIENMFYIIDYIDKLEYLKTLLDGSYRFIGATLLHTISSATIGLFIALVFFQKKIWRRIFAFLGLFFATGFHAIFNFLVLSPEENYQKIAFYASWFLVVIILIIFEFLDRDHRIRPKFY